MPENKFKLHWTSLNCPLDHKTYYWEIGTIFDFHVEPIPDDDKHARNFILSENKLEPRTRLIVTSIRDTETKHERLPRFFITAHVFNNGTIEGKPIEIGHRTIVCRQACYLEKTDTYMVKITEAESPVIADEFGNIHTDD